MRRLLLDTHVFLWWQTDDPKLGDAARARIRDAEVVFVSAVSGWEIAIKQSLGKLSAAPPSGDTLVAHGFVELPVRLVHADAVAKLAPHHRDPFDRMLIAQCAHEDLVLVTGDSQLEAYGVPIIWA